MLEKITNAITDVVRTVSGKATISEKNIDEYVEKIKIALLDVRRTQILKTRDVLISLGFLHWTPPGIAG